MLAENLLNGEDDNIKDNNAIKAKRIKIKHSLIPNQDDTNNNRTNNSHQHQHDGRDEDIAENEITPPLSNSLLSFFSPRALFGISHPVHALSAFLVLFCMNVLNYTDRYVPSGAKAAIIKEFNLNDFESGIPLSIFIVTFILTAPFFAYLSDIGYSRRYTVAGGVAFWSCATLLSAASQDFIMFCFCRALVGVGEASYYNIAVTVITDYYPPHHRSRMLALFGLSTPIGSALGLGVGAGLTGVIGWRLAFLVAGLAGIPVAVMAIRLNEFPKTIILKNRGTQSSNHENAEGIRTAESNKTENNSMIDSGSADTGSLPPARVPLGIFFSSLIRNQIFVCATLGFTCLSFGASGLADFAPLFLFRLYSLSNGTIGLIAGICVLIGGVTGTAISVFALPPLQRWMRDKNAEFIIAGVSILFTATFTFLFVGATPPLPLLILFIGTAQLGLWCYLGMILSITSSSLEPTIRTRALAVQTIIALALGNALAPPFIGKVSDATNIQTALLLCATAYAMAGFIWLWGAVFLKLLPELVSREEEEEEKSKRDMSRISQGDAEGMHT